MQTLIFLIRIIFLPLRFIVFLVYPELHLKYSVVAYSWYRTKDDYRKVIKSSTDDTEELVDNFEEWQEIANERLESFRDSSVIYLKIAIKPKNLFSWLKRNGLENNSENRQKYVLVVYENVVKNGVYQEI